MNYFVGLKSELDLLNESEAKQRYLEMLASGYKPDDVFVGAPVGVSSDVNFSTLNSSMAQDGGMEERSSELSSYASGSLDQIPLNPS